MEETYAKPKDIPEVRGLIGAFLENALQHFLRLVRCGFPVAWRDFGCHLTAVLQCVAMCCGVLRCVAVCCHVSLGPSGPV